LVEGFLLPSIFKVIKSRRFCTEILPDYYLLSIRTYLEFSNYSLLFKLNRCNILLKRAGMAQATNVVGDE